MSMFDCVADNYSNRTDYSEDFFLKLAGALDLDRSKVVLDIATGTGPVARGIAGYVKQVFAFDQSAEMLARAEQHQSIEYFHHDMNVAAFAAPELCDHAVIGRAIQHLDEERLRETLDISVRRQGWIAICSSGFNNQHPWVKHYEAERFRYRGDVRSPSHNESLSKLERIGYSPCGSVQSIVSGEISASELFQHALSYSGTRTGILERRSEFSARLDQIVAQFGSDGKLPTAVVSWARLYRPRP